MSLLLNLFLTFAKIGLFTFGGGYAMISLIENQCVERKKWITHDEMMNITVIALFWLVPVGMPLQGLVRLFSDTASRADDAMALVSFAVMAVFLVLRTILCRKKTKKA